MMLKKKSVYFPFIKYIFVTFSALSILRLLFQVERRKMRKMARHWIKTGTKWFFIQCFCTSAGIKLKTVNDDMEKKSSKEKRKKNI